MNGSAKKPAAKNLALLFVLSLLILGCAAGSRLQLPTNDRDLAADALHRYLDRWVGWRSLTAGVRMTVATGDTMVAAKGHIMYLLGERFELGFVKPYNRILGNFYVTPAQFIYWDVGSTPHAFAPQDTVSLSDLLPIQVPDWDPRDMLPFPVSGRSGGFQPDSMWVEGSSLVVSGVGDDVDYRLYIARNTGRLERERVARAGHDVMLKQYGRSKTINGWPVATKATCSDSSGEFAISWSLSGIHLDAEPFRLPADSTSLRTTGSTP
jgi:hypothetical protein